MNYILITSKGKVMQFYILATAECFQNIYGGSITGPEIFIEVEETVTL